MTDAKPAGDLTLREPVRLLGVQEIAQLLPDISKERAEALTYRDDFPAPVADLAAGAVWVRADVESWLDQHRDASAHLPERPAQRQTLERPHTHVR